MEIPHSPRMHSLQLSSPALCSLRGRFLPLAALHNTRLHSIPPRSPASKQMSSRMEDVPSASSAAAAAASSSSSSKAASAPSAAVGPSAAAAGSRYTYVVTAQPPTLVSHAAVGSFTGPHDRNLLLVRGSRLEIYRMDESAGDGAGLESLVHVPLYARVSSLLLFRFGSESTDRLLVLTERHKFFLCRWDARSSSLDTLLTGDSKLRIGRVSNQGALLHMDPQRSIISIHQYDSILQVIAVESDKFSSQIHECKLEQLQVIQMAWMHKQAKPTLMVLCVDGNVGSNAQRRVKSYTYEAKVCAHSHAAAPQA